MQPAKLNSKSVDRRPGPTGFNQIFPSNSPDFFLGKYPVQPGKIPVVLAIRVMIRHNHRQWSKRFIGVHDRCHWPRSTTRRPDKHRWPVQRASEWLKHLLCQCSVPWCSLSLVAIASSWQCGTTQCHSLPLKQTSASGLFRVFRDPCLSGESATPASWRLWQILRSSQILKVNAESDAKLQSQCKPLLYYSSHWRTT